jgi:hypothetical protein
VPLSLCRKSKIFLFLSLVVSGCSPKNYPEDWAAPRAGIFHNWINEGCADLQGTWDIKDLKDPDGKMDNSVWPLFGVIDWRWSHRFETLTISGDSRAELTLRLDRSFATKLAEVKESFEMQKAEGQPETSPEARFLKRMDPKVRTAPPYDSMTDDEYEADLKKQFPAYIQETWTRTARRGREYICDSGWLVELYTNDPKMSSGTQYAVGVNKAGELIRSGERTDESYFSFWCGDHCDNSIRLPDVHRKWWQRRKPTAPIVEAKPSWQVPFQPVPKPMVAKESEEQRPPKIPLTHAEIRTILAAHLPSGVSLKEVAEKGGNWLVQIQAPSQSSVAQFLLDLGKAAKIEQRELIEVNGSGQNLTAKIWVKTK